MPLTITHSTPADGTFSATGAAAWDATHTLSVTGTSGQIQYNNAGDFAGMSGTSWNDTTRSLTLTGATVTASAPVFDLSQTWNNAAVAFDGLVFNATDTASAATSSLLSLKVNNVVKAIINKAGTISAAASNSTASTGVHLFSAGRVQINNGSVNGYFDPVNWRWPSTAVIGFVPTGDGNGQSLDTILTRRAAANLRLGAADAAAPVAQTLSVQSVVAGTTNTAGANLTITGSQGTGTGAGGSIIFQVAPAGSSGTAQNALADALTIASNRTATFAGNVTAPNFITSVATTASVRARGDSGLFTLGASDDVVITRDAANTLALRNGTNAQTLNVYNTFTSSTNFERFRVFAQSAASVLIGTEKGSGGGTARALELQTDATSRLALDTVGSARIVTALTVATLPGTPLVGMMARVTDATAPVVGSTVVGGGAAAALVWYNGANWTVIGV